MKKEMSLWERERQRLAAVLQPVLSTQVRRNEWAYELAEINESCAKVTQELMKALVESSDDRGDVIDHLTDLVEETRHLAYHLHEFHEKYDGAR